MHCACNAASTPPSFTTIMAQVKVDECSHPLLNRRVAQTKVCCNQTAVHRCANNKVSLAESAEVFKTLADWLLNSFCGI